MIEIGTHTEGPRLLGYRTWGAEVLAVDTLGTVRNRDATPGTESTPRQTSRASASVAPVVE